jgi:hypothetical protein
MFNSWNSRTSFFLLFKRCTTHSCSHFIYSFHHRPSNQLTIPPLVVMLCHTSILLLWLIWYGCDCDSNKAMKWSNDNHLLFAIHTCVYIWWINYCTHLLCYAMLCYALLYCICSMLFAFALVPFFILPLLSFRCLLQLSLSYHVHLLHCHI